MIGEMNGLFVHPLRSHSIGQLTIRTHCFVIVFEKLAFFLRRSAGYATLPLACFVFISQDFYMLPVHDGEVDAAPLDVCEQSTTKLLITQGDSFQVGCVIEKGVAQV